jgi:23S rRNA (adenine2030-N6)-methyltransferase
MLSYQHGYHAGNRADVLKHAVLDALLREIIKIPRRTVFYIETHSGRGQYDLTGPQAVKGGEAAFGVEPLLEGKAPKPLSNWLSVVRAKGKTRYPGSPALAQAVLPEAARFAFFEKHPAEYKALVETMGDEPRAQIKKMDGYSGALKLQPRGSEQLVCLVDPSYETERDMDALADWAPRALKRWPNAIIIMWLPLFRDERELEFGEYLASLSDGIVAGARWPVNPENETALEGSAMIAYRAPEEARETCAAIASTLQSYWSSQPAL